MNNEVKSERIRIFVVVFLIGILLIIGTFTYHELEGWDYVDSFYFSVASLTSAGYGDICPTTEISKIFTSFYLLFGVSIFFYGLFIIGEHVINKRMGRLEKMMQRKVKEENEESKNKI